MAVKDTLFCLLSSSSKAGCEATTEDQKKKVIHVSTLHLLQGMHVMTTLATLYMP